MKAEWYYVHSLHVRQVAAQLWVILTERSCARNQRFCNSISIVKDAINRKRCNFEPEMQDFAILFKCVVSGPKTVFLWVHSKKKQKKNVEDNNQSITMLAAAVKILVLNQQKHPKHRLCCWPADVMHLIITAICLAFPVRNYIFSILITSYSRY